jgi:hypothetical protein
MDTLTACTHDRAVKVQSHYSPVDNGAACYAVVPVVSPSRSISLETNVAKHTKLRLTLLVAAACARERLPADNRVPL